MSIWLPRNCRVARLAGARTRVPDPCVGRLQAALNMYNRLPSLRFRRTHSETAIRSVRHRGLCLFLDSDSLRLLNQNIAERMRAILIALAVAENMGSCIPGAPPVRRAAKRAEHFGNRQPANYVRGTRRRNQASESGGLSLMGADRIRVGMTPSHPGVFIRMEVIEEFGLTIAQTAEILGVRQETLSIVW